ncbi:glycosyltransferase [Ornithinimicrobium cryptoxanthini]|uniref:Glycosyltransferase n=1 Tax=Ornithinimicrobium cryptoxanthini TaxID=2934161 RepID=A0ABY4YHV3_9MICO|nr:glycosyltransferase [Ornithinimicrobium cryptoxanthini]USQ76116.1 glycosyltransferase [Ornithinimicrobium cryptoxanthini]
MTGARASLRVTFLATVLTPRHGMEHALLRLATALAEHHTVEILVLHDPGPVDAPTVTVTSLDRGTESRTRRALRQRLRAARQQEVVVVTGVWAGAQLLLATPWAFRSAVAWEHSLTPQRLASGRRFRLRAETVARCYRLCAGTVSVSPVVATLLDERWRVDSTVIPNLLDLPERSPGHRRHDREATTVEQSDDRGPVRLLALGEAKPVKNYDVLIRALPLLDVDWRLTLAGGGTQQLELRALADSLGVGDRIEWLGFVADPTPLLIGSDLLVHPSASETFGYVLLEAAEQWLPVVATDAPVMNRLVPAVVPGTLTTADPPSLAEAIVSTLARSPQVASDLVAADETRRREFDRAKVLAAWEGVLHG